MQVKKTHNIHKVPTKTELKTKPIHTHKGWLQTGHRWMKQDTGETDQEINSGGKTQEVKQKKLQNNMTDSMWLHLVWMGERVKMRVRAIRVNLPFCVTSMEQAHFWSHQHLPSHCMQLMDDGRWEPEDPQSQCLRRCSPQAQDLKSSRYQDVSFLPTKATFSGLTTIVTILPNSGSPLQCPDDNH